MLNMRNVILDYEREIADTEGNVVSLVEGQYLNIACSRTHASVWRIDTLRKGDRDVILNLIPMRSSHRNINRMSTVHSQLHHCHDMSTLKYHFHVSGQNYKLSTSSRISNMPFGVSVSAIRERQSRHQETYNSSDMNILRGLIDQGLINRLMRAESANR